jgi:hypothetical protein
MTETGFQLPTAGYEALVRIIVGYLRAGANKSAVTVSNVADLIAVKSPNISSSNGFLVSTEILERSDKGYKLTPDGLELAKVLDYLGEDISAPEVRSAWQAIVAKNDFLRRVSTAVRVRGSMDTEAFARHIALTGGAPNKPQYMTGARTIITILKAANELIEDEDGTLKVADDTKSNGQDIVVQRPTTVKNQTTSVVSHHVPTLATMPLTLMIQVTPATNDDELVKLAQRIKRLIQLINAGDEIQDDDAKVS